MKYGAISQLTTNAYHFCRTGKHWQFANTMKDFYTQGKQNPSVALTVMQNTLHDIAKPLLDDAKDIAMKELKELGRFDGMTQQEFEEYKLGTTLALMEKAYSIFEMPKNPILKILPEYKVFYDKLKSLYPKSLGKRTKIIERNLIDYRSITPKTDWITKISLTPSDVWRKIYPKTFDTRMSLILEEQIKEGTVTPKLKDKDIRRKCKGFLKAAFRPTHISTHQ